MAGALLAGLWYWRREFYAVAATRRPAVTAAAAAAALLVVFGYGIATQIRLATQAGLEWSWMQVAASRGLGHGRAGCGDTEHRHDAGTGGRAHRLHRAHPRVAGMGPPAATEGPRHARRPRVA